MTHLNAVSVAEGLKSSALWAVNPTGTAVVFVHGFGGSSVGSWSEFEARLPDCAGAAGADILFFGYDAIRAPAQTSATILRGLLEDWMTNPTLFANGTLPREDHRERQPYSKLIVVAHSSVPLSREKRSSMRTATAQRRAGSRRLLSCCSPRHTGAPRCLTSHNRPSAASTSCWRPLVLRSTFRC